MGWRGEFDFTRDAEHYASFESDGFTESVAEWFSMESPSSSLSGMRLVNCKWHHYKTLFESDPSHVPDGWEVYTERSGSIRCRVVSGSDELSSRYPVPMPSSTATIQSIEQRKFLFAKTSRCRFVTRPVVPLMLKMNSFAARLHVELCSTEGGFAGFLHLHQASEVDRFLAFGTVELVAVAKGWTKDLDDFLLAFEEQEKRMATQSLASTREEPSRYRMAEDQTKHKCYFVLCIQWEHGVAKRQASGKVFAEVWEKNQEPVDLVLG